MAIERPHNWDLQQALIRVNTWMVKAQPELSTTTSNNSIDINVDIPDVRIAEKVSFDPDDIADEDRYFQVKHFGLSFGVQIPSGHIGEMKVGFYRNNYLNFTPNSLLALATEELPELIDPDMIPPDVSDMKKSTSFSVLHAATGEYGAKLRMDKMAQRTILQEVFMNPKEIAAVCIEVARFDYNYELFVENKKTNTGMYKLQLTVPVEHIWGQALAEWCIDNNAGVRAGLDSQLNPRSVAAAFNVISNQVLSSERSKK